MKKIFIAFIVIISLTHLFSFSSLAQTINQSGKEVKRWYKEKSWLNGLTRTPHKSVNREEFSKQYRGNKAGWDKAFAFLRDTGLANMKPGRYTIDGENVFAIVSDAPTKELDETMWEAHKNYHDIHYVIRGKEKIGIAPVASAIILKEYDAAKDIAFYTSKGKYYTSDPNRFFIVLTQDAHRPGVKAQGFDTVKKVVIKIRKSA